MTRYWQAQNPLRRAPLDELMPPLPGQLTIFRGFSVTGLGLACESWWEHTQHTVAWLWPLAVPQKCLTHNMKKNKNQFWELMFKTFLFKIWLVVRNCISATKTLPAVILESIRDFINSIWLFYIHMAPPTKKERCKVCWATGRRFMRSGL